MPVRIIAVKKKVIVGDNPLEAISTLQWEDEITKASGTVTTDDLYEFIMQNNPGHVYVKDEMGKVFTITGAVSAAGKRYIKTAESPLEKDVLLRLPEERG